MTIERAILAAVESAGVSWGLRVRVAGLTELASSLAAVVAPLDIGHKKDFLASLIGECAQESDWFCAKQEYGGPGASYAPYYGRGFIQLTHRVNYIGFTTWARNSGYPDCPDFVSNPDAICFDIKWCWLTGVYYYIANIAEDYWVRHDWDAISGIINAGNPGYRGPSFALRAAACNAAYNVLSDWEDDDMPSAEEVAKAVWAHGIKMYGKSNHTGKEIPAATILGWLDDQFSWVGKRVLETEVTREGLPGDDPRAGGRVSVEAIFAWLDAQFANIADRMETEFDQLNDRMYWLEQQSGLPSSPETASEAPQRAAESLNEAGLAAETGVIASEAGADGTGADFYGAVPSCGIDEVEGMPGWYKVKKGDTARLIAKKARLRYSELVKMNPELQTSFGMVSTGQLLRVREG